MKFVSPDTEFPSIFTKNISFLTYFLRDEAFIEEEIEELIEETYTTTITPQPAAVKIEPEVAETEKPSNVSVTKDSLPEEPHHTPSTQAKTNDTDALTAATDKNDAKYSDDETKNKKIHR